MSLATITRIFTVLIFAASLQASSLFNQVYLKATHNSYANTPVGTILHQLNSGCRIIELDIYDTQLATAHDFLIGHAGPGNDVHLGDGNPQTPALSKWLKLINHWSDSHRNHAPIVIYFDLKNGSGFNNGSLALLDEEVARIFGEKFYLAWHYPGIWPSADSLRGKILIVFTGAWKYRKAYRWDQGRHPAIAMNARGQVVEVHESGKDSLWYWTGQYEPDGTIAWHRHGKIASGILPTVAMDDHGDIVEIHGDPVTSQLACCAGRLQKNGEVTWQTSRPFLNSTKLKFYRPFSLDRDKANLPDGRWVTVSNGADAVAPADTLRYSTPTVTNARLTYEQRSFIECDQGDPLLDRDGLLFFTAPARVGVQWGRAARQQGKIVRLWQFNSITPNVQIDPPPANYPATDYPYAPWYDHYLQALQPIQ
jgi:hypothetical protein